MRVGLIGSGNMARAMARGWGDPVLCSDTGSGRAQALADELGGRAASNLEVDGDGELVVLCRKPYQLQTGASQLSCTANVVVSALVGTDLAQLSDSYPDTPVFRIEPST